ncbi:helix-hairpin-helix domain-containing protein [Pontibacter silvestris]|uniref:Helix-hairpin-helix domain-containing protein n=1 Tax=Pontibacter silvestris TaxID=2305183 RepID=A0ABW4WXK1_9BACT|nr:helix-hairpin-helix domain-containing protein [Pontibacter silvestris]MCC9136705.1 helix-hairpin-helix domain-containing protein [Pontibacter silvestris]
MVRYLPLCWFTFYLICPLQAQDYPRQSVDFDLLVQELFAQQEDEDIPYEDFYETLFLYYQRPLNLNNATPEELASLFILSRPQIASLFKYIEENGRLLSIYELQAVPDFDLVTIYQLVPFVRVQDAGLQADQRPLWQRVIGEDNNALIMRYERTLQQRRGYMPVDSGGRSRSRYLGSPEKLYLRYRVSHARDYSFGITAEKDAGEQFTWSPETRRYGFDFYSAHLQLYNKGKFKAIALGDYQLQIGQGLLLSSGYSVGKGSETINTVSRANLGIRPYSSVLEYAYFRGAAATYNLGAINVTSFYSIKRVDANLQAQLDTLESVGDFFTGIQTTGFHRTPTELANKRSVREQTYGANASYQSRDRTLNIGLTAMGTHYSSPIQKAGAPYQRFEFNGTDNYNIGTNYSYTWQNIYLFGETAISKSGGLGTVNGLVANLSNKAELALLYRHYARNFHSSYGNAFGEGTRNINETGFYTGIKLKPFSKWELTAYYDRFRFPWLRYLVDAPSYGIEYLIRLYFRPSKLTSLYAQFRTESKGRNFANNTTNIDYVAQAVKVNYLLYYEFSPTRVINLKSRVQFSSFEQESPKSTGYLIAQDINLNFSKIRLSTRYAIFDTDSYDTRQYVYERDVLYAFSIPAFSGRGTRLYTLLQFRPLPDLDIWIKYGLTHYRNQSSIGSGLETIEGARRSDVKVQVRYKF